MKRKAGPGVEPGTFPGAGGTQTPVTLTRATANATAVLTPEKVLIAIDALIHTKSMYITYGIYLSYILQTESNY